MKRTIAASLVSSAICLVALGSYLDQRQRPPVAARQAVRAPEHRAGRVRGVDWFRGSPLIDVIHPPRHIMLAEPGC